MPNHEVKQGECAVSLGHHFRMPAEKIWLDGNNRELSEKRPSRHILHPGDSVFVPDLDNESESAATEERHRFRLKFSPAFLRVRVLEEGEPLADLPYRLSIGDQTWEGTTDGEGKVEEQIPPTATDAVLEVDVNGTTQDYVLCLGSLDPLEEVSGIQARLNNLGFDSGPVDGISGPRTRAAVMAFQKERKEDHPDMMVDGIVGPQTRRHLKEVYGC